VLVTLPAAMVSSWVGARAHGVPTSCSALSASGVHRARCPVVIMHARAVGNGLPRRMIVYTRDEFASRVERIRPGILAR
jgi:hypothetical protein